MHNKFQLWRALSGTAVVLIVETILLFFFHSHTIATTLVLVSAFVGAVVNLYSATEAIEEVRSVRHMLVFLSILIAIFVLFFALQYNFLLMIEPGSFSALTTDPLTLILHSLMVLIFNPIFLPITSVARALLIVNTIAAMVLVFFLLQNIWQFRSRSSELGKK